MDGSSKFVKGDAIAALLILGVNIIGGLILGMVSHGMAVGDAARAYLLLAIGDALVAQIPALMLSIAAAAIVTRVASSHRSEEHTSELQSLMRISYAGFCLKKKKHQIRKC